MPIIVFLFLSIFTASCFALEPHKYEAFEFRSNHLELSNNLILISSIEKFLVNQKPSLITGDESHDILSWESATVKALAENGHNKYSVHVDSKARGPSGTKIT